MKLYQLIIVTFVRLALNTARRFMYTFAPALSRSLGVPLTSITSLIALNQSVSVAGVLIAPLADRYGYKIFMLLGIGLLAVGMVIAGCMPVYATVLIAMVLGGLGKCVFDPAIQAYVGERVPYEKRALYIGTLEFAWAGSTVIGIPLAGILIDQTGWQNTFLVIGMVSLIGFLLLFLFIPAENRKMQSALEWRILTDSWKVLTRNPAVRGMLLFSFFISYANDTIFVVYASWLEVSFGLGIVALGMGTSLIGAAEITAELFTVGFVDRMGMRRSLIIGLMLSMASFLILPTAGGSLPLALGGLFLVFFTFEFSLVTALSLSTELAPQARASMMSAFFAAAGMGRALGAMTGGILWGIGGLNAVSGSALLLTGAALAAIVLGMRSWTR